MGQKPFKEYTSFQKAVMIRHIAKLLQHSFIASALPKDSAEAIASKLAANHLQKRFESKYGYLVEDRDFIMWCVSLKQEMDSFIDLF